MYALRPTITSTDLLDGIRLAHLGVVGSWFCAVPHIRKRMVVSHVDFPLSRSGVCRVAWSRVMHSQGRAAPAPVPSCKKGVQESWERSRPTFSPFLFVSSPDRVAPGKQLAIEIVPDDSTRAQHTNIPIGSPPRPSTDVASRCPHPVPIPTFTGLSSNPYTRTTPTR